MTIKLVLQYKYDRVYPSRFQPDYYILTAMRKQFERMIPQHFGDLTDGVLVDYGCGNMPYKPFFEKHVSNYIGVDVPSHFSSYQAEVDVFTDETGRIPDIADNSADIVFSIMVLEHVDDPALYLSECFRVLKPGGKLFLSTLGYWIYHAFPVDYWRWTFTGLGKIIDEAGFEIDEGEGVMGLAPIGIQLLQDGFSSKFPKFIRSYWIYFMQHIAQLLDRCYGPYRDNRDAAAYTYIATKPAPSDEEA